VYILYILLFSALMLLVGRQEGNVAHIISTPKGSPLGHPD